MCRQVLFEELEPSAGVPGREFETLGTIGTEGTLGTKSRNHEEPLSDPCQTYSDHSSWVDWHFMLAQF